jgi:catechol 2,3-dioxygenase-like lactoylglutathione lyase family enzyme
LLEFDRTANTSPECKIFTQPATFVPRIAPHSLLIVHHSSLKKLMFISGIQQVGIGVQNVHEAFNWYRRHFGMDIPMFEEAATAGLMLPYTGGEPRDRHAILAINLQGGGGMEIWQYTSRTPVAASFQPLLGDLGIFIAKVKSKDVEASFQDLKKQGADIRTQPAARPDGRMHFFVKDPWGNLFEVVESDDWFIRNPAAHSGGMYGCTIGVSDMDRSIRFYADILGYDTVVYDQSGQFADWKGIDEGADPCRRVLLRPLDARKGPFSELLGATEIELVQSLERTPRKIFEGRFWGDLGFIHLCFDITGMTEMKQFCAANGHPFTVDSSGSFDMGEAAGYFSYIEDPDGTLIEFVETHKIPIMKKIGWYLDLRTRSNPAKPLPKLMLRALGLGRVKDGEEE